MQPWYDDRDNLLELYNFLAAVGLEPEMPQFIEKPYNWEDEYNLMRDHPDWSSYSIEALDELQDKITGYDS